MALRVIYSKDRVRSRAHHRGFTLIELLVVIALISLLTSVVLASLGRVRTRTRDLHRVAQLRQLQTVIESYKNDTGEYPKTFNVGDPVAKRGECSGYPDTYIPNVVPNYISRLPTDPALNCLGLTHSWFYASDGRDYKLVIHVEADHFPAFTDPAWDNGLDPCVVDGGPAVHYAVWTDGAACWSI